MRALLALLLMLSTTAAYAGGDIGVVVTGEATMQPQLAAQLEGWLRQHGHQLIASPLPPEAVNTLIDCFVIEDENCARGVIDKRAQMWYLSDEVSCSSTVSQSSLQPRRFSCW